MKYWVLLVVATLLLAAPSAEAVSWIYRRPVDDVAWAIGKSQPRMSLSLRRAYAETILREGKKRKFDSFTLVAMCHNESRWNAHLVGGAEKKCHGLCQHCVQFKYKYCASDYEGERCQAKRQWLLNGHNNIVETAGDITRWREYVRQKTGQSALFHRWLQGFQGYNRPKQGLVCGMRKVRGRWKDVRVPKQTRQVMNYRKKLIRWNQRRK